MKTLFLYSHGYPDPEGQTTVDRLAWHYLRALAEYGPVTLLALLPYSKRRHPPPPSLRNLCADLLAFPAPPSRLAALIRLWHGFRHRSPPMLSLKWNPEAERFLEMALRHARFDLWVAHSPLALGLLPIPLFQETRKREGRPRLLLATEEVLWRAWEGYRVAHWRTVGLATKVHARFHRWMANHERAFARLADRTLCLSAREADALRTLDSAIHPTMIPLFVDTIQFHPAPVPQEPEILFTGFFGHPPNREAALELGRQIWPKIHSQLPMARLHLAGRGVRRLQPLLPDTSIRFSDSVPSLVPLYQRAALVVGPIRSGEGVRGKFLEALACGCPVITTPLGASGIQVRPEEGLLLAETPAEFIAKALPFLRQPGAFGPLRQAAAASIQQRHSLSAWRQVLGRVLTELAPPPAS